MLLAEHGHDWCTIWPILWLVIVGGRLVPEPSMASARRPLDGARKILAERLARGELSNDEYQERLTQLG